MVSESATFVFFVFFCNRKQRGWWRISKNNCTNVNKRLGETSKALCRRLRHFLNCIIFYFFCLILFVLQDKGTDVGNNMGLTNTQKTECSHGEAEPRLLIRAVASVCVSVCVCAHVCMGRRRMDAGCRARKDLDSQPEPSLFKCNNIQHKNRESICCHCPPTHDERLRPVMLGLRLVLWQLR